MAVRQRITKIGSGDRVGPAILAVYVPFAVAGAAAQAGRGGRILFAVLYVVSALCTPWLLISLRRSVQARHLGRLLAAATSLLLALAALGHIGEASVVLGHPALSVANADKHAGSLSGPIQAASTAGLILGTLLLCVTLSRASLTRPWPTLLFLLMLPAGALPHGAAQQLTRSLIVLSLAVWLALSIRASAEAVIAH